MFISKAQLEAIKIVNADKTKRFINGLHVTENEVVATDGHRMIVVEHGKVPEFDVDFEQGHEPNILPNTVTRESIEAVLKSWPKVTKRQHADHHDWAWLGETKIHVIGAGGVIQFPVEWTNTPFMPWKRVMPQEKEMANGIALDMRYLADGDYLSYNHELDIRALDIRINDPDSPALCIGQNKQAQHSYYTIMPIRLKVNDYTRLKTTERYMKMFADQEVRTADVLKDLAPISDDETVTIDGRVYFKSQVDEALKSLKNKK